MIALRRRYDPFWDGKGEALFAAAKKDMHPRRSARPAGSAHRPPCLDDAGVRAKHANQVLKFESAREGIPANARRLFRLHLRVVAASSTAHP